MVPFTRPVIVLVNAPAPVPSEVLLFRIVGEDVVLQQTPRSVTVVPPSVVIVPPLVPVVLVIALIAVVVIVGVARVVKFTCDP